MSTKQKTLRQQRLSLFLTIAVFSAISFPILLAGSFEVYRQYQKEVVRGPENDANALFFVLKKGLIAPLWSYTPETAEDIINGVALNPSVERIVVQDGTGDLFTEYVRQPPRAGSDKLVLSSPVFFEDQLIGNVELVFDYSSSVVAVAGYATQILLIGLVQLIFSISIILLILKHRVTEPLRNLKKFAVEVSKQNFDAPAPKVQNREFIELVDELDLMKQALSVSFVELEEKVAERTVSLRDSNRELATALNNIQRTQETLVQNEKLAALGALVAGVAHELNTPIGNVRLVASTLGDDTNELVKMFRDGSLTKSDFTRLTDSIHSEVQLIERNISQAVTLIQNFKQVAVDRTSDQKREFSLNHFVEEIESTLRHIVKSKPIEIQIQFDEDCTLYTYPGTLSQVIDNLVNNALLHAFEGLELSASDPGIIIISTRVAEKHVFISVSDNGIGLSLAKQSKIYEPFYTTKLGKGGSGLGMHIVHNLVNGPLEGKISIDSTLGEGSVFTVEIPKRLES